MFKNRFFFYRPFIMFVDGGAAGGAAGGEERPEGVSEDAWNDLGEPGKSALRKERKRATDAEKEKISLERQVKTLQSELVKKKAEEGKGGKPDSSGQNDGDGAQEKNGALNMEDVEKLISAAVNKATQPLIEAAKNKELDEAIVGAASAFYNPKDALLLVDKKEIVDENGNVDEKMLKYVLENVAKQRPYLLKPERQSGSMFLGGKPPASSVKERSEAALQRMQQATGINLRRDK